MKHLVKFFVITASLFFITHSLAETKLAFIDMDKILNGSKAGKAATLELNELNKRIVLLTGSELRHDFFRKFIASTNKIDVILSYCESNQGRSISKGQIDRPRC